VLDEQAGDADRFTCAPVNLRIDGANVSTSDINSLDIAR
jgi:hypothetical protein